MTGNPLDVKLFEAIEWVRNHPNNYCGGGKERGGFKKVWCEIFLATFDSGFNEMGSEKFHLVLSSSLG